MLRKRQAEPEGSPQRDDVLVVRHDDLRDGDALPVLQPDMQTKANGH
jgi:hypothetical protein